MGLRAEALGFEVACPFFCPFSKVMKCFGKDEGTNSIWYDKNPICQFLIENKCHKLRINLGTSLLQHCKGMRAKCDWFHSMYYAYLIKLYNIDDTPKKNKRVKQIILN